MEQRSIAWTKALCLAVLGVVFGWQVYQTVTQPVRTNEAYLYDRFVRPPMREVWEAGRNDGDFLYALLEKRSVGLFHVSPFSVRLPALCFLVVYLWAVWRMDRWFPLLTLPAALLAVWQGWFGIADGFGPALALELAGGQLAIQYLSRKESVSHYYLNLSGACFGLAIAARTSFAPVSAVLILVVFAALPNWRLWIDRVAIPAIVVSFILLILPLSHADAAERSPGNLTAAQLPAVYAALGVLRADAGASPVSIGANPQIEPIVNFYRAYYRASSWQRASSQAEGAFDYYLIKEDVDRIQRQHLIVLFQDKGIALARESPAR